MDTEIYKALLRPPSILGVPANVAIFEGMLAGLLAIFETFSLVLCIPFLHAAVFVLSLHDPYLIDTLIKARITTLNTQNKRFWQAQSYAP